jgi:hypothetical protein
MTPIEKAKWLAEFYGAIAEGKIAQVLYKDLWQDRPTDSTSGPTLSSSPTHWRIKPEQRRKWEVDDKGVREWTYDKAEADGWKSRGYTVTEWVEIV